MHSRSRRSFLVCCKQIHQRSYRSIHRPGWGFILGSPNRATHPTEPRTTPGWGPRPRGPPWYGMPSRTPGWSAWPKTSRRKPICPGGHAGAQLLPACHEASELLRRHPTPENQTQPLRLDLPSRMATAMGDEGMSDGLSAAELAERADGSQEELERMIVLGILVPRRSQAALLPRLCSRNGCLARWSDWIPSLRTKSSSPDPERCHHRPDGARRMRTLRSGRS